MFAQSIVFAAAAFTGAALVSAQAAPNWQLVPSACASACSQTVKSSYQCQNSFTASIDIYACYCASFPSDASSCATCLTSNNAAALGTLVTSTITACPAAAKQCAFECSFPTCASADVACQCSATYLQNIYNCASCNTKQGLTGVTLLSDYQALDTSCKNQNYTGAGISRSVYATPTPAAAGAYNAPALTASGGGAAATGGSAIAAGTSGFATGSAGAGATAKVSAAAGGASSAAASAAKSGASTTGAAAVASASKSGAAASGAAVVSGATQSITIPASTTSKSAAMDLAAPATGILAAVAAAVAALL